MDLEVGATSSQLDGHESTHPGASDVVGGLRYHTRYPSLKHCRLRVANADLLMILDGRKRKRIMLIGNEPQCFPGN